jgi:hypothetical protein
VTLFILEYAPLRELHSIWAGAILAKSSGAPPSISGIMWSAVQDFLCPAGKDKSIHSPHKWHLGSALPRNFAHKAFQLAELRPVALRANVFHP